MKGATSPQAWDEAVSLLPCHQITDDCIATLQNLAVKNSKPLAAVDERIALLDDRIVWAEKRNRKTIKLSVLEPALQTWLFNYSPGTGEEKPRGLFDNLLGIFTSPGSTINKVLSAIGLPLFRAATGTNQNYQNRAIAITELKARLSQLKQSRDIAADQIRQKVTEEVISLNEARTEWTAALALLKAEEVRFKMLRIDYQLGRGDTTAFLNHQKALDQQRLDVYRKWAKVMGLILRSTQAGFSE